jgi:hypothetical protein
MIASKCIKIEIMGTPLLFITYNYSHLIKPICVAPASQADDNVIACPKTARYDIYAFFIR